MNFPELLPIVHLLYGGPGTVDHCWADGSWRSIEMSEGVNQECPLSVISTVLVVDRVLHPLDALLQQQANDRVLSGDNGDDGHMVQSLISLGGLTTAGVPLVGLKFFCDKFSELAVPLGLKLNPFKTQIFKSCNGNFTPPPFKHSTHPWP